MYIARLSGKAVLILAAALGVTFLIAGTSGASVSSGNVYTSNGEAGWFTWSATHFDEVHADVITTAAAEQVPAGDSSSPVLGNGVGLCAVTGVDTASAAQEGEVWDAAEGAFDVVWAEGTLTATTPEHDGNPCTDGGAVPVSLSYTGGTVSVTCPDGDLCGVLSFESGDVPLGDRVYLNVRYWYGSPHIQFLAEDLSTGLGSSQDSEPPLSGFPHYAQAGSISDLTSRSAPPTVDEAFFSWVRASTTTTGQTETQGQYFSTWSGESVDSNPSGSSADPALVAPTLMNPHVPGGLGCFTLGVGAPVGA